MVQLQRQQAEDAAEVAEQGELLLAGQRDVWDAVESQQLQLEQLRRELADSTVEHVLQVSGNPCAAVARASVQKQSAADLCLQPAAGWQQVGLLPDATGALSRAAKLC